VATDEQDDPGPRSDAADAEDFPRRVHVPKALEQTPTVTGERAPVRTNEVAESLLPPCELLRPDQLLDGDDQGRVADDARLAVDELGQLAERLQAVLGPGMRHVLLGALALLGGHRRAELGEQLLDVDARVPEVEVA